MGIIPWIAFIILVIWIIRLPAVKTDRFRSMAGREVKIIKTTKLKNRKH